MPKRTSSDGVLALDIGTSSVRAAAFDARGDMLESSLCHLPYKVQTSEPGEVSSDPDALVALIAKSVDKALAAARKEGRHIFAVATSCYWHSLMGIDKAGRPTTELLTWADTRSSAETARLRASADEHPYHRRTGCFFHPSFWPAKLRWLRATRSAAVRRTARWLSLGEYLYKELFGELRVSVSMASGTGLLDVNRCRWDPTALRLAAVRNEQLSALAEWDQALNGLGPAFAKRWPELESVPWFLPVGDGALANLGSGAVGARWACVTIGTSAAMRVIVEKDQLRVPWGVFAYRLDRRHLVVGGALSEGGNVLRWFSDRLGLDPDLAKEAADLRPDEHGLTVLPFWAGERSPNWRGDATAVIAGLSLRSGPADLLRAAMEAIAYQFAAIGEAIDAVAPRPELVIGTGGQLVHSPLWAQMLADCLNLPLVISPEVEASSRGAALLALHAIGRLPNLWSMSPGGGRRYRPRRHHYLIYKRARDRQQQLYDLLFSSALSQRGSLSAAPGSGSRRKGPRSRAARR